MMSYDEMISVMKAARVGRTIQRAYLGCPAFWSDCLDSHLWNFAEFMYRVKPEPNSRVPQEKAVDAERVKVATIRPGQEFVFGSDPERRVIVESIDARTGKVRLRGIGPDLMFIRTLPTEVTHVDPA